MRRSLLLFLSILLFVPATVSADTLLFEEEAAIEACSADIELFENCKHWLTKVAFQDLIIFTYTKIRDAARNDKDKAAAQVVIDAAKKAKNLLLKAYWKCVWDTCKKTFDDIYELFE